jgi:hypothetical protein
MAVNAAIFVKRDSIAAVEHRRRFREIRVDIVGKEAPITLRYMLDTEGEDMMNGLIDCMKDVPHAVEKELEQMRAKEVAARAKIDLMKAQMGELRELLEQIAANTTPQPAAEDIEIESVEGPVELSEYETASECEDKGEAEITLLNDTVITFITIALICLFLSSAYIYVSRVSAGFNQMTPR